MNCVINAMYLIFFVKPGGVLLFCDHYFGDDGMSNDQLYMNRTEQRQTPELTCYSVSAQTI